MLVRLSHQNKLMFAFHIKDECVLRYNDISGKELIDISTGARLGVLGQTDIVINKKTGKIESFILYDYKWFGMKKNADESTLSWDMIEKVGDEIILVNLEKG